MNFRKRLPKTNTKSRPNTLLTPFIAPAGPDPDTVCTIMECPALKVNRAISMIVWVNSCKNIHVAGAMKSHATPEAGFCYQSKETTVPPPLSSRMRVRGVSDFTICVRGAFETVHRLWSSSELRWLGTQKLVFGGSYYSQLRLLAPTCWISHNFWYLNSKFCVVK